jgi:hypothetical protein
VGRAVINLEALTAGRSSSEFQQLPKEAQHVGYIAMDSGCSAREVIDAVLALLPLLDADAR